MIDFQLSEKRETKLIRNTATFFIHLVCESFHILKYTLFRHSDKILLSTLRKIFSFIVGKIIRNT